MKLCVPIRLELNLFDGLSPAFRPDFPRGHSNGEEPDGRMTRITPGRLDEYFLVSRSIFEHYSALNMVMEQRVIRGGG